MHLSRYLTLLLILLVPAGTTFADGDECVYPSEAERMSQIIEGSPYGMSYEGFFPRSSQGIQATAYLDDDRAIRALRVEYLGEVGRSAAVFRFDSRWSYSVAWEDQIYEESIHEDPSPTIKSSDKGCFVVVDRSLQWSSPGSEAARLQRLKEDLNLILSDYMPCEPRFGGTSGATASSPQHR